MPKPAAVEILEDGRAIAIALPNGARSRFHAIWLRDNAWDEKTRAPGNGQRLITLGDIPADTRVAAARAEAGQLHVTFLPERRTIAFDLNWLAEHAYDGAEQRAAGWTAPEIETWDAALQSRIPEGDFSAVSRDQCALRDWLGGRQPLRLRQAHRRAGRKRRAVQSRRALWLYPRDQLRQAFRGAHRGQPDQPRLYGARACRPTPTIPTATRCPPCRSSTAWKIRRKGGENMVVDGFRAAERLRARKPARLRPAEPLLRAVRICRQRRRLPAGAPADDRACAGWRADRHPLQQPLGGGDHRRALSTTWRTTMPPTAAWARSSTIPPWR